MLALILAFGASTAFALGTILQERAATALPHVEGGPLRLIAQLARTPRWLAGKGIDVLAFGLQALALAHGTMMAVQAVLASGVAIALVLDRLVVQGKHCRHSHLERRAWLGIALIGIGLPIALAAGNPEETKVGPEFVRWTIAVVAVLLIAMEALIANHRGSLFGRPSLVVELMAFGAGCLFAIDAAYLTYASHSWRDGVRDHALGGLIGFLVFAVLGNVLIQRAFQLGPLGVALPVLIATEVVVALVLGSFLLGEHLRPGVSSHLLAGLGALGIITGAAVTARFSGRALDPVPDGSGLPQSAVPSPV